MVKEWALRNLITYLVVMGSLRGFARPRFGKLGVVDILLMNTIGDLAAHTVFESEQARIPGLISVAVWVAVATGAAWLAGRWPGFARLYYGGSHQIVSEGLPDVGAMRAIAVSVDDLQAELRKQSIASLQQAKSVTVEADGSVAIRTSDPLVDEVRRLVDAVSALTEELRRHQR